MWFMFLVLGAVLVTVTINAVYYLFYKNILRRHYNIALIIVSIIFLAFYLGFIVTT